MRKWIALVAGAMLLASCGGGGEGEVVQVFAAASMTDAVSRLALEFESTTGTKVSASFGASSTLARQIADGAPGQVFVSANQSWVEYLADNGLLQEAPVVIAGNELVCIVPRDSTLTFASLQELAAAPPSLIAIAGDGVPAGEYARQALQNAGYLNTLKPRLVGQKDARAVVTAVQTGNAAAGFVYLTDARLFADTVGVAFTVDRALHDPIAYYAALLSDSKNARAFFLFLQSQQARAELAKLGF